MLARRRTASSQVKRLGLLGAATACAALLGATPAQAAYSIKDYGTQTCSAPRSVAIKVSTEGNTYVYANGVLRAQYSSASTNTIQIFTTGYTSASWEVRADAVDNARTNGTCF